MADETPTLVVTSGVAPYDEEPRKPWTAKRFTFWVFLIAMTLATIIFFLFWLPSAMADAPGGCGGG